MADTGIFATTAEILRKAGLGASAVSSDEAYTNDFIAQAESYINVLCSQNFSDVYATLNTDIKCILKEAASNLAAIYVVQYDVAGYSSDRRAENIINILWQRFNQCIKLLNEKDKSDFVKAN
jgi:hypothetical protein